MADKKTVVYEIKIEEGQAIQAFEALNLKQQENRDRLKEINVEIKANKDATASIVAEISTQNGATDEQNAALESLKLRREELNRQQAEAIIIGKDLTSQAAGLIKEIIDLAKANDNLKEAQDRQAESNARQVDAMEAAENRAKLLSAEADRLFDAFNTGDVSETAFQNINSALIDTRAELARNKAAIAENGKAEQQLAADIRLSGVATEEQVQRMNALNAERAQLKAVNTSLVTTEGSLAAIYRETKNDVTGLTEAELRFRDKMADATTAAIKNSGALAELQQISARFTAQQEEAAKKREAGVITERQFTTTQSKTLENIQKITAQSQVYSTRLDELNAKLKSGSITEEEFKAGVKELTVEVETFGKEVVKVADTSIESLKKQLREAKAEAQIAFQEFGRGSEEFQRAAARVDDIDDSIKAVNVSVQAIDLEGKIESVGRIAQGISGGFQVATGVMALFGTESEAVQESLLKVQAAMAIGQGINQLIEGGKVARGFAISVGLITTAQEGNAVATGVATAATGAQTAATGTATVATRVLGATMNALPLIAVISAISAMVLAVSLYNSETVEAVKSNENLIRTLDAIRDRNGAVVDALKTEAEMNLELRKIREGRSQDNRNDIAERGTIEQQAIERRIELEEQNEERLLEMREKAAEELRRANAEENVENQKTALENDQRARENLEQHYIAVQALRDQSAQAEKKTQVDLESFDLASNQKRTDEAEKAAKERANRIKQVEETIRQDIAALRDRTVASTTGTADDDAAELARIREKYAKQIEDAKGFADQIIELERLRDEELLLTQNEQQQRRIESLDAFKAKEAEAIFSTADSAVRAEEAKWEALIATTRSQAIAAGKAREEVDAEVAALEADRDQALLQQRLARIDAENEQERIAILQKYEGLFADADANNQDTAALQAAAGAELLALHTETEAAKTQATVDANAARAASNEQAAEADKARTQAVLGSMAQAFDQLQAFSDAGFDSKIRDVTEQTEDLQAQLDASNNDEEKARIKERIEGLNKEKAALEERKKSEKTFAIASALINTYLGAQQAFSNPALPFPSNIIAGATIIAAGLLNVAKMQGFDKSGKVRGESGVLSSDDGRPIRRDNGDDLLVTAQVGEMYVNKAHQRRAQQLYGDDIWRNIGIPGFADSGIVELTSQDIRRLSGYAGSGVVDDLFMPQPSPQVITQVIQAGVIQAQVERPIIVDVREVTNAQDRVASITEFARA